MDQGGTALLRGGSRDGETTAVEAGVRRLLAVSDAPGLLDVYEETGEMLTPDAATGTVAVFAFAGQEPTGDMAPESLHMPAQPEP